MKKIGTHLKNARKVRGKTLKDLSEETKIKVSFIKSIEAGEWDKLPEFPVVVGFVKNIAQALDLNRENVVALLRRDYPPQKLEINPRPEPPREFRWSPRLTFLTGVSIILIAIISYLVIQYNQFRKPPSLEIIRPEEGAVITQDIIEVTGTTDSDANVTVNDQPAFVDDTGHFYTELEISESLDLIEVTAESRSGKMTSQTRRIIVE